MRRKLPRNEIFFQENSENIGGLFREIAIACRGLVYISETDAPVLPFSGPAIDEPTGDIILELVGNSDHAPVEELAFDAFFGRLTEVKDWYGEAEKERAKRF